MSRGWLDYVFYRWKRFFSILKIFKSKKNVRWTMQARWAQEVIKLLLSISICPNQMIAAIKKKLIGTHSFENKLVDDRAPRNGFLKCLILTTELRQIKNHLASINSKWECYILIRLSPYLFYLNGQVYAPCASFTN